ncbi:hypothetical protein ScPMuIL_001472 [Solemya velum]
MISSNVPTTGPGIFTSPTGVQRGVGSVALSLLIWTACGVFTTLAGLCFAELQMSVRRAGCEYGYIHKAFGPIPTFVYTWMRLVIAEPVRTAVFALAFSKYISDSLYNRCGAPPIIIKCIGAVCVVTLAIVNAYSARLARRSMTLSNASKVIVILTIIICGIIQLIKGKNRNLAEGFQHSEESHFPYIGAIYSSLWAYGGWANVPTVTVGVRKPPKNLPRLIKIVIPFVTCVYMLVVTSYLTVLTKEEVAGPKALGVAFGDKLLGSYNFLMPIGICLVALGNANATFMGSGRISSVAVGDGYSPEVLSYVSVRSRSNIPAIALRTITALIAIFADPETDVLVSFYVYTSWLFHGIAIAGLLIMRVRKKDLSRPYKVNIAIPILVLIGSMYITIAPFAYITEPEFIFTLAFGVFCCLLYILFVRYDWSEKVADSLTVFIQLLLEVTPQKQRKPMPEKTIERKYSDDLPPDFEPPKRKDRIYSVHSILDFNM